MAVISIDAVVSNIDSVMAVFDKIKFYRSTTTIDGTYTEITTSLTRPTLVASQIIYTFIDETGDPDYFYKTSYYNSSTTVESSLSDAVQGEGDPALDIISITELKTNYLFGLDLTDDSGTDYPDTLYQWFIRSAVSWIEHRLDIAIRPTTVTDERHDFINEDYKQFMWLQLKKVPVISVTSLSMILPGELVGRTFDSTWIHLQKDSGQINVVPGVGGAGTVLMGAAGLWYPLLNKYGGRLVPEVFRATYTAGFVANDVPDVIKDLVGKTASFGPLNIAGDLLGGAGIASQSISMDGLSQTFNTTSSSTSAGYGARLLQYQKEIKEVIPTLRRYYRGVGLTVV